MDAIFGRVTFRFRHSIADSIMMWILHSAMDKAHEKVQSKVGVIGRLHEISKFYELALMQLDGCLKFVQEEVDSSLESSDEEVLGDLAEIRDRLERRLMESEQAIAQKDRELTERIDNELVLRQVLETKQNELDALRVNLDLERKKSEELFLVGAEDGKDGEFSVLKNSVEQQVLIIRQKLDTDNDIVRMNQCFDDVKIEEMRSDIDVLKETMDIAFGRMQCPVFLSELEPDELQLEWMVAKDATAILIKGFMGDIREHFDAEVKRKEKQVFDSMSNHLSELLKEVASLRDELQPLHTFRSIEEKSCFKARSLSEGDSCNESNDENLDEENGHLVAKMIKNHESIIRRKSEELSWFDKVSSPPKREKNPVSPRRKILGVIMKLEKLVSNAKLEVHFGKYEEDNKTKIPQAEKFRSCEKSKQKTQVDTLQDAWDKMSITPIYHVAMDELHHEIRMLQKEKEDRDFQYMVMEQTYFTLLQGFVYEFCTRLCSCEFEMVVREATCREFLKEMVIEWDESLEKDKIQDKIKEEIECIGMSLSMRDLGLNLDTAILENKGRRQRQDYLEDLILQGQIQEKTNGILFKETYKQWNEIIESYDVGSLINEKRHRYDDNAERSVCNNKMVGILENFDTQQNNDFLPQMSYSVKEDVDMILLGEIPDKWKNEMNFDEHVKQADTIYADAKAALHKSQVVSGEKPSVWKQDSQVTFNGVEEGLAQGSSLELRDHDAYSSFKRMKYRKLKGSKELVSDLKCASDSMCSKVNKALEQLRNSMSLVGELRSSCGISSADNEMVDGHLRCANKMEPILQLEKASEMLKLISAEFQSKAEKKLNEQILRVEEATRSLDPLAELVGSLKEKELLYKRAFISRSDNLRKAEIEVDLLADQVGVLQDILYQIYMKLHQHSPVLQKYFEVSDILEMIMKELQ